MAYMSSSYTSNSGNFINRISSLYNHEKLIDFDYNKIYNNTNNHNTSASYSDLEKISEYLLTEMSGKAGSETNVNSKCNKIYSENNEYNKNNYKSSTGAK